MTRHKTILFLILIIFLISTFHIEGTVKTKLAPFGADKYKVIGHSQFLGYLNAYLNVKKGGAPLPGQSIFLDTLKLRDLSNGRYSNGTPYVYDIAAHKLITIKLVPKPALFPAGEKPKPIVLGTYKVNNHIEWVYPRPDSKITLGPILMRAIKFRWNYTGAVLKTRVRIKNFTTNTEILNKTVTAEEIDVPVHLFVRGNKYRFDLEVDDPVGLFKLTRETAPGSKIEFFYWDHIYFDIK